MTRSGRKHSAKALQIEDRGTPVSILDQACTPDVTLRVQMEGERKQAFRNVRSDIELQTMENRFG
jgi:hypothetical protein